MRIMWIAASLLISLCFLGPTRSLAQLPDREYMNSPVASDGTSVMVLPYSKDTLEQKAFRGLPIRESDSPTIQAMLEGAEVAYETDDEFVDAAVGLAAFDNLGAGSIIGPDSRGRVSATTTYPARAIVLITFDQGACTGWLYGPDIVATAGHCVHSGGLFGNWYSGFKVYPGRNGRSSPYGFCRARTLHSVHGWTSFKDEQYDYGAIKLDCTIGNTTGWFGYFWQSASLNTIRATVAGYPGDKTSNPMTQWRSVGPIAISRSRQIFYLHDTFNGQSGAPVYQTSRPSCSPCSMGIHNMGIHGIFSPHRNHNHAVRITQDVFNNLLSWKNGR